MSNISRFVLSFIALLFVASLGFSANKRQVAMFNSGDADGDGSLNKAEFVAVKVKRGKEIATENKKEFDAEARAKGIGKSFAKFDKDGNGKLSDEEFYASFQSQKKK